MSIPLLIPKAHASKQYDGSSICDYSMARLVLNSVFNSLQPSIAFLYPPEKNIFVPRWLKLPIVLEVLQLAWLRTSPQLVGKRDNYTFQGVSVRVA